MQPFSCKLFQCLSLYGVVAPIMMTSALVSLDQPVIDPLDDDTRAIWMGSLTRLVMFCVWDLCRETQQRIQGP